MVRYLFAAAGSAVCLPAIEAIGVGWFTTISSLFMVVAAGFVILTTHYGENMRAWIDGKQDETPAEQSEEQNAAENKTEEKP